MCLSSPVRTPKLQLTAEQPSTGECWIPPKKDTPRPRAKEKPQQDCRRGEMLRGLTQTLCAPGPRDPTETEPELCLSVSCRGTGRQWPAAGAGALDAEDLGMT